MVIAWSIVALAIAVWVLADRWGAGPATLVRRLRTSRLARGLLWMSWAWLGWHLLVR
jgi:hypothetical protein